MTSPEWEAANEDDSDRFPQTPHASAPASTESHEQGSRVVPDPARVARYAEAICRAESVWLNVSDAPEEVQAEYQRMGRAVLPLMDEEQAELVAENERLRARVVRETAHWQQMGREADREMLRAESAEAEVKRLRVRLAKVEALAVEAERGSWPYIQVHRLRAVLADAPAEQRAEGGA